MVDGDCEEVAYSEVEHKVSGDAATRETPVNDNEDDENISPVLLGLTDNEGMPENHIPSPMKFFRHHADDIVLRQDKDT